MTTAAQSHNWLRSLVPFVVMCVGMFIALLDIQIVASSLQNIGGGLSAAQDQISWVQTAYLIAEIIMIPLSGWLTRVFSTRWLFTISAAGFTIASMLCGLAWNIQSMIFFRALQGLLGASMIPTVFTSSFHYFQGPSRVYSAAVIGTIASVAPALGPVIGGWITDTLNWHWLFYINLIPGALITILIPFLVKIDKPDLSLLKDADYPGIVLMAIFLGTLEYVLEEGTRWNWFDDETIRNCALIAAVAGSLFIVRSLTFPRPVVDLRAFGNRNFALGCILSFVTGVGIFSTIYLTPLFLGYVRGFSAWQTGIAIFSTGVAALVGVPVYIVLARKFDTRWLMMFGLASFGFAMWSYSFITHDWGGTELFLPQILRGFPQVFAVAPSVNLGLGSLPPERLKYASGLFNMMRNLGGAVGIAVSGAILNDRTNFHFLVIASHLTPANGAMERTVESMTQRYGSLANSLHDGHVTALKKLWQLAYREASTMAYADAFRVIMVAFMVATLLVPFLRNVSHPRPLLPALTKSARGFRARGNGLKNLTAGNPTMRRRDILRMASLGGLSTLSGLATVSWANEMNTENTTPFVPFRMEEVPPGNGAKITVQRRAEAVLIGLNRPYIHNRIDPEAYSSLAKAYYDYDRDPSLRAAILFGHGDHFSRGIDVDGFNTLVQSGKPMLTGEGGIDPLAKRNPLLTKPKPALTKPLIVAVHGDTWNMAHELFLVADIRIAAANTNFGQDENTHGRFPGGGSTVRFVREAGWGNAMRYMLTGDHWTAEEALRMGTVQEVAATPERAFNRAIEIANKVAVCGPLGIKTTLASAHFAVDPQEADALEKTEEQYRALYKTRDFQEGRKAEAEGRPPAYHGD